VDTEQPSTEQNPGADEASASSTLPCGLVPGEGGYYGSRAALERRAAREGWNVPPEARREAIEAALAVIRYSAVARDRIAAARLLVAADSCDIRRDALARADRRAERAEASRAVAALLASPEARAAIAALSEGRAPALEPSATGQAASSEQT
jgi:hypothetical protein